MLDTLATITICLLGTLWLFEQRVRLRGGGE